MSIRNFSAQPVSRRRLLGAAGAIGLAAASGASLSGCSDPTKDTNTAARNSKAVLPTYVPVELIKPDLPGSELLMPGYYAYPKDPKPVFDDPPGAGLGSVSVMYTTFVPTPPSADKNAFYARLQERLGCELKISAIPSDDYGAKFQTIIAGGDVPDVCNFPLPTPDQPRVMNKVFADLGPYLGGDAAKDYPYLANIPTASWKPTVSNGTIYAVTQPRALSGASMYTRRDIIDQLGANQEPKNYQEFLELLTAVTDKKKNRWAFANPTNMVMHLKMMLGAPNGWSESGGTFTSAVGDERHREAVSLTAGMIKKGLFHPDSASIAYTKIRDLFFGGRVALTSDGYAGWDLFVRQLGGGEKGAAKLGLIVEPKHEGGGDAAHFAGTGFQGITVIKKDLPEDKIKKILNVLNFLAAPIGSREHLERKYGVEGTDYTWTDGLPALNSTGNREFMDLQYITDAQTIVGPGVKAGVDYQHAWNERVTKDLVHDPTIGLYSDTYSRKGKQLNKILDDAQSDVLFGRKPMKSLEEAYKTWRSQGGDDIAKEYAESKNAAG
ncbi:extracellular solute-binding protein [Microlunatus soli]|uniref:Carbohydrate ABC transporter substrate-binding protein, CUT1 family n=1 Tax=Microlunatus soli TaxID=630515 RepID=A0A1H1ZC00_9ACTN|nr:extracellular solute-binding protein [Microlunatus soli]SDT31200.1 carbohydrate ABC transporter substrate-binding protein, CUT1 family [Microlunatus soli]